MISAFLATLTILPLDAWSAWRAGAIDLYHPGGDRDDCILLLNPDVILDHRYLEELVRVMDSAPGVGVMGGKLLLGDP